MTIARGQQIDSSVTRWYHCVTRCVRRAFLLGEGTSDREVWIENRIEELRLVDYTARLLREGKAAISSELAGIFERLGCRAENWQLRMEKLRKGRLFGRFFAASRDRLQKAAEHLGMRRVANLAGCPVQ